MQNCFNDFHLASYKHREREKGEGEKELKEGRNDEASEIRSTLDPNQREFFLTLFMYDCEIWKHAHFEMIITLLIENTFI